MPDIPHFGIAEKEASATLYSFSSDDTPRSVVATLENLQIRINEKCYCSPTA